LPISQQAIQASHATYVLGTQYGSSHGHPSFVFLEVKNKEALERALFKAQSNGITACEFHEPYCDWGLTAFACEPITEEKRGIFANYSMWRKS